MLLPLHPRTLNALRVAKWTPEHVEILPPASLFQMLLMESRARFILTDSGGVQKEAYFMRRPCITLREETEWVGNPGGGLQCPRRVRRGQDFQCSLPRSLGRPMAESIRRRGRGDEDSASPDAKQLIPGQMGIRAAIFEVLSSKPWPALKAPRTGTTTRPSGSAKPGSNMPPTQRTSKSRLLLAVTSRREMNESPGTTAAGEKAKAFSSGLVCG